MKNAIIYRTSTGWLTSAVDLSKSMGQGAFCPCFPTEQTSMGWVKPAPHAAGFAHQIGRHIVICLQIESKILPQSVVSRSVQEEVSALEDQEGRKIGRKEKADIAENVRMKLLPKAFSKFDRVDAYIDTLNNMLVVDSSSPARAEDLVSLLMDSSEILVEPFMTAIRPEQAMRQWLLGEVPPLFTVDDECELVRDDGDRPAVKYSRHSLSGADVQGHLGMGKLPTRMAITFDDRASFVLTDKLHIKRFSLTDTARRITLAAETEEEEFDANIALYAGEMANVIGAIEQELGGPKKKAGGA